ncbi:Basic immunoglobulin-like variable motif-containing protein [Manis javanica]|nr:Basic immunoglobulin-like variable motif-containing protein [Manis javanica]
MQIMDEIYKIASTERVLLLEKELAAQLTEQKSEIEGPAETLQGPTRGACSSVRIPKDVSYLRSQKELALKKMLQVAGAKPFAVQADVLQREQESYLRREPTPENSPLLLLQVTTRQN